MKSSSKVKFFSIIICSFNEGAWLEKTVESIFIQNQKYWDFEIILVDDGSTDVSFQFIKKEPYKTYVRAGKIKILRKEKVGISRARHAATRIAKGKFYVMLDAHMSIEKDWLTKLNNRLNENPEIKILGTSVTNYGEQETNRKLHSNIYMHGHVALIAPNWILRPYEESRKIYKTPFTIGCNLTVSAGVYREIGGYPTFTTRWGIEDVYLCLMAYYYGYDVYVDPHIFIGHLYRDEVVNAQRDEGYYQMAVSNFLAAAKVLYDEEMYKRTEVHIEKLGKLDEAKTFVAEVQKEIDKRKEKLDRDRKRTFNDFRRDFGEFLTFLYTSAYDCGVKELEKGNRVKAIEYFNEVLRVIPYPVVHKVNKSELVGMAYYRLADIHKDTDYNKSLEYVYESLKWNPLCAHTYHLISIIYLFYSPTDSCRKNAIPFINSAIYLSSISSKYYSNVFFSSDLSSAESRAYLYDLLGYALFFNNEFTDSVKAVQEALRLFPDKPQYVTNLAAYTNSIHKRARDLQREQIKRNWINNKDTEIGYWEAVLCGKIKDKPERMNVSRSFPKYLMTYLPKRKKVIKVLDVGSGPVSTVGTKIANRQVILDLVDPMADEYMAIIKKYAIKVPLLPKKGFAENLSQISDENTYDLVYSENALDHAIDPIKGVREMLKVVRKNCYVVLLCHMNEASTQKGNWLHQWNFYIEGNDFIMSDLYGNKDNITALFGSEALIEIKEVRGFIGRDNGPEIFVTLMKH